LNPFYLQCMHQKTGRHLTLAITMFRGLLLQSWHNLSNVMLSKMLGRDLLFKRFSGFSIVDQIPDHSTFSGFKSMLKIGNKVKKRGYRNHPLSDDEQKINQTVNRIKYVIERTFGAFKRHYSAAKTFLLACVKNECWITLISIAHTIKKAQNILSA